MAAAQVHSYIFIANVDSDSVSVIDSATNTVTTTIAGIDEPRGIAVTPNGRRALVASNGSSRTLVSIDVATLSVIDPPIVLPGTDEVFSVVITPDGTKAYASRPGSFSVAE